jgi:K+-sensing histidine kinase KdpD
MVDAATTPMKHPMLSQGAHEIRNPAAVIIGYVRMLTGEKMGPVNGRQQKILNEISASAAKLAALAEEMSFLGQLQVGSVEFNKTRLQLAPLILAEIATVPAVPERETTIRLMDGAPDAVIDGDKTLLHRTLQALLIAHRRELIYSTELVLTLDRTTYEGRPAIRISMAGADLIDEVSHLPLPELAPFFEFRGNVGFSLSIAREVIVAHGGVILSRTRPREDPRHTPFIDGAVFLLPEA